MKDYMRNLKEAIRAKYGCDCYHLRTTLVRKSFAGEPSWGGNVEVFELAGHRKAEIAYAWHYRDGEQKVRYVTQLASAKIRSPVQAVEAAVESGEFSR